MCNLKSVRTHVARAVVAAAMLMLLLGAARAQTAPTNQDAWSVLESDPNFSDVVAVLKYAGLSQYIETDRFTAFFPTNAAFDSNPGVLAALLKEQTTTAVIFMRSHAIYDLHPLSEFSGRSVTLTSISGNPIEIDGTHPGKYTVRWISVQSQFATAHLVDNPIVTRDRKSVV